MSKTAATAPAIHLGDILFLTFRFGLTSAMIRSYVKAGSGFICVFRDDKNSLSFIELLLLGGVNTLKVFFDFFGQQINVVAGIFFCD